MRIFKDLIVVTLVAALAVCCTKPAPKVLIFGDSYSTFEGCIPDGYAVYYSPEGATDVHSVDSTWWSLLCARKGYELLLNSSYSGSTICNVGYGGNDYSDRSFVTRIQTDIPATKPDIVLVFGGTNDSWAGSPLGELLPPDRWQEAELRQVLPSISYMLGYLKETLPDARIVVIVNSDLSQPVTKGLIEASTLYGAECVTLERIDKQYGHPTIAGMKSIAAQVGAALDAVPCDGKAFDKVDFSEVSIDDSFWSPRLKAHKEVTIPVCIDQIENQTGRMRNFENAAKGEGEHSGIFFDDSDVYKALEGMAYSLQNNPDPELEAKCDEWIDKFAAAQQPDGYINTFYTLTGLENRWHDMNKHEMYCAGHMIEAAVAYYNVTGKDKLLGVCERMVAHMMDTFGPGKRDWVPGHEEIELALVKLYETTGKKKYLEFANWLLDERGHGYGSFGDERKWPVQNYQDQVPVSEMTDICGHAVRLMYLLCGMADVDSYTGKNEYTEALYRVWYDVVYRNMYLTGGIGASSHNEGFDGDYNLPNADAYCETCASVGMVLWNWRMNRMTGDGRYVDVLERALYNGVLSGISLKGDKFFYVNPLESDGNHHRQEWFGCACCPSQLCRFLPSIGNYIYGVSKDAIWVNLFIGNKSEYCNIETGYPWTGDVRLTLGPAAASRKEIRIRIPSWCPSFDLKVNGEPVACETARGYAVLRGGWHEGDEILLDLDVSDRYVTEDPRVREDLGKKALMHGPLVYCLEHGEMIPYFTWDNGEPGPMKVWIDQENFKYDMTNFNLSPAIDFVQLREQMAANPEEWEAVARFVAENDLATISLGRHDITNGGTYCNVQEYTTKLENVYEAHKAYIDIQVVVKGSERIFVAPLEKAGPVIKPYSSENDCELYADAEDAVSLPADAANSLVLFPNEAHMPGMAEDGIPSEVRKIVFKIPYSAR